MATSTSKAASQVVVVLGAGPGLGFSCARAFARRGHPVALLSRTLPRLQELAASINKETNDPHRARPYAVDATKRDDVHQAMRQIAKDAQAHDKDAYIHTAVHNPGGNFMMKAFMDLTEDDLRKSLDSQAISLFNFAQAFLATLQDTAAWKNRESSESKASPDAIGNLLVTGATASLRGGIKLGAFAASNFAMRALAQSIAREYGPQGVHVAHFLIDGIIDTERVQQWMGSDFAPHSRMDTDAIADVYVHAAEQPRSVWAFEMDLRPSAEKW